MIEPTKGRLLYYCEPGAPIWPALVVGVHSATSIDVIVFTGHEPWVHYVHSVTLLQDDQKPFGLKWCEWMPYQTNKTAEDGKISTLLPRVAALEATLNNLKPPDHNSQLASIEQRLKAFEAFVKATTDQVNKHGDQIKALTPAKPTVNTISTISKP